MCSLIQRIVNVRLDHGLSSIFIYCISVSFKKKSMAGCRAFQVRLSYAVGEITIKINGNNK